jgi:hypothetical protein
MKTNIYFYHMEAMFHTKVAEKIKTHNLRPVTFFFFLNRAVHEIMWKNTVAPCRPQTTI